MIEARPSIELVKLRDARLCDVAQALEHGRPWLNPQSTDCWLVQRFFGRTSFVAIDSRRGACVAVIVAGIEFERDPLALYVDQVAVAPDYRGMGIARQLLDASIAVARAHVVHCAWLTTDPSNPAVACWRSLGFDPLASSATVDGWPVHRNYKGPGRHRIILHKRL